VLRHGGAGHVWHGGAGHAQWAAEPGWPRTDVGEPGRPRAEPDRAREQWTAVDRAWAWW
jgi:hypothetical protein